MLGFKRFETASVTIRGIPVSRENQETTIQPQTTNRKSDHLSFKSWIPWEPSLRFKYSATLA